MTTLEGLAQETRRLRADMAERVRADVYASEREAMRKDIAGVEASIERLRHDIAEINKSQVTATRANVAQLIGILVTLGVLAINVALTLGT